MSKARLFHFLDGLFSLGRSGQLGSGTQPEPRSKDNGLPKDRRQELPHDYSLEAIQRARLAADNGDPIAQNKVGLEFVFGPELSRNQEEGCKLLRRAAEQGYAEAQFNLGNLYYSMSVRHPNPEVSDARIEAYRWFHLAAGQGHLRANAWCETLNLQLTNAELDEGNRRIRACQSRKEAPVPSEDPIR
jgi:TPR repeat protein